MIADLRNIAIVCRDGIWYFGKHFKPKKRCIFLQSSPYILRWEMARRPSSNLSGFKVAVTPGCTFAHVWRVTLELVESELSLVTLW